MGLINRLLRREAPAPVQRLGALEISRPWARISAAKPGAAAGFFTVRNTAASPDRLAAASCPLAERVEMHAIKVVGSHIAMRALENGLAVPPETTLTLKPRGYHLYLTGLATPPAKGMHLPVVLAFERAGTIELDLVVEDEGPINEDVLTE